MYYMLNHTQVVGPKFSTNTLMWNPQEAWACLAIRGKPTCQASYWFPQSSSVISFLGNLHLSLVTKLNARPYLIVTDTTWVGPDHPTQGRAREPTSITRCPITSREPTSIHGAMCIRCHVHLPPAHKLRSTVWWRTQEAKHRKRSTTLQGASNFV